MVKKIRKIETMLGKSKIYPTIKEISARKKYHRYLVANGDILLVKRFQLEILLLKGYQNLKKDHCNQFLLKH